jgi:hypothetical protein
MLRRALPRIKRDLALEPGMLRAFEFRLSAPPQGWPERVDGPGILWIGLGEPDVDSGPGLWVAQDRETLDACLAS